MEIRNALQKIENYLTVVSNLNRTILSEGTMSRDELLLMKKYLYTSIDRIEDIERALIMESQDEQTFEPNETMMAETLQPAPQHPEIVQVASVKENVLSEQIEMEKELEQIQAVVEETPVLTVQVEAEEQGQEINAEQIPDGAGQFAQAIITEDFVVDEIMEEPTVEIIPEVVAEVSETTELEVEVPTVEMPLVAEAPVVEPIMVATPVVEAEIPLFANLVPEMKTSLADELVTNKKEEPTLLDKFGQQPQSQLFQLFDDGKEELHETFSSPVVASLEVPKSTHVSAISSYEHENVLVAEKEEKKVVVETLTPSSLNEVFKPQVLVENVNAKLGKTLSESIALNDKFIFVRELFGNQFAEYENGLKQLDALHTFDASEQYCKQHFWTKYNWDAKASAVERFRQLLLKKFN